MSRRTVIAATAGVLIAGLVAVALAAGGDLRTTAFSLDVPPRTPVVRLLANRGQACQAPVEVVAGFSAVHLWTLAQAKPGGTVAVTVRDAAGRQLAAGRFTVRAVSLRTPTVTLDRTVAAGRRISVCLDDLGPKPVLLDGAYRDAASGAAIQNGKRTKLALAMVFDTDRPPTLLSLIPTVFQRASLYRFSFVGAWTFWALAAALLVALVLAVTALVRAATEDEDDLSGP